MYIYIMSFVNRIPKMGRPVESENVNHQRMYVYIYREII